MTNITSHNTVVIFAITLKDHIIKVYFMKGMYPGISGKKRGIILKSGKSYDSLGKQKMGNPSTSHKSQNFY
jgi:hypothetical protein